MDDGFYELRLYGVLRSLCRPTHKPCALQWRLDVRGSVAPPRGKVGFDPPRGLPPRHPRLGALEDRFDVVPVGVDDEGGIVVGVVALAQARGPVVAPPAGEGGGVEGVHRLGIRSDEGEVERRAGRLPLDERQVLGILRPKDHGGSPRLRRPGYVGHLGPQRLQGRSVELQGAREIGDPDDYVIDKGGRTVHRRTVLPGRPQRQAGDEPRRPDLEAPQGNILEAPRAKFRELRKAEVQLRRIPIPSTQVNKYTSMGEDSREIAAVQPWPTGPSTSELCLQIPSASSRKHRTEAVRTSENHPGNRQPYSARLDGDWKNFSRLVRLALEKPFERQFERLQRFGAG